VIEIGKHITPDLSVTYGQGVMGETEKQVQVEYRINRHLSIQTQVGSEEQSGVDVFWRYDFGK
jgi:autotransporter translocation and assembly factor TamB